ncbi:hypothetical protein D3C71_1269280 [compost metagenome]
MGLHTDPVNEELSGMSRCIPVIKFFDHVVDGIPLHREVFIEIIVIQLDIAPFRVVIQHFSCRKECLFNEVWSYGIIPS